MNKQILITSALAAGATALIYLLKRRKNAEKEKLQLPIHHSRHMTEVFSRAKQKMEQS